MTNRNDWRARFAVALAEAIPDEATDLSPESRSLVHAVTALHSTNASIADSLSSLFGTHPELFVEGTDTHKVATLLADALVHPLANGALGNAAQLHQARTALFELESFVGVTAQALGTDEVFALLQRVAVAQAARSAYAGMRGAISSLEHVGSGQAFAEIRDNVAPSAIGGGEPDREAQNALAVRVGEHARAFLARVDLPKRIDAYLESLPKPVDDPGELASTMEEDGILFLDELFARDLETLGINGKKAAKELRRKSHARMEERRTGAPPGSLWSLWNDPSRRPHEARWIAPLARVLWLDVVGPAREHERKNPPALVMPVHEDVARIHSRARKLEEGSGQRALVFDDHDPIVITPTIADEAVNALVARGVGLLGSITAHRALRWELYEGHSRAQRGEADARVLRVDGGWSTFAADMLGLKKKSAAEDLRAIVHAQASVVMKLPSGSTGNMLALRETPQRGRTRGSIEIVLGTMLLPHYVYELADELGKGRNASESKRLVPVVDLPPMVGRANDHGQQATLSMLVVRELRARARELASGEGAPIDLDRWASLAQQAGLPRGLLERVRDRWTQDGPDGPAFLEQTLPGRYTLGGAHAAARAFLEASGRIELDASEAGKRSVAAREAKRRRLGRGR